MAAMAENVRDATWTEVARLRVELEVWVVPFFHLCSPWIADSRPRSHVVLTFPTFAGAESREETHHLGKQLRRLQEEVGRLQGHLNACGAKMSELWIMALGACCALFPRGVHDNAVEVNARLRVTPERFCEAVYWYFLA